MARLERCEWLEEELEHWARRSARLHALLNAGHFDPLGDVPEKAEYADGVTFGLELALQDKEPRR